MISLLFNVDLLLGKSAEENKKRVTLIFLCPHHQEVVQNCWAVFFSMKFVWRLFIIDVART